MKQPAGTIWTIGHSNHDVDAFVEILAAEEIELVADVRRFAGSRRHPQFQQEALSQRLADAGLGYRHFVDLGGRRRQRLAESRNTAWRVESFNAYADHMQSPEFRQALDDLQAAAREQRTVIMCAEALPWRCHRRLIADALTVRGWTVLDLLSRGQRRRHELPDFAAVEHGEVVYPGGSGS